MGILKEKRTLVAVVGDAARLLSPETGKREYCTTTKCWGTTVHWVKEAWWGIWAKFVFTRTKISDWNSTCEICHSAKWPNGLSAGRVPESLILSELSPLQVGISPGTIHCPHPNVHLFSDISRAKEGVLLEAVPGEAKLDLMSPSLHYWDKTNGQDTAWEAKVRSNSLRWNSRQLVSRRHLLFSNHVSTAWDRIYFQKTRLPHC